MNIMINGDVRSVAAKSVQDLIAEFDFPAAVLVEHNGLALRRDEWPHVRLEEDDRLEIIRIVAGG
jgi:thiamine biosynthesis protein ThiS